MVHVKDAESTVECRLLGAFYILWGPQTEYNSPFRHDSRRMGISLRRARKPLHLFIIEGLISKWTVTYRWGQRFWYNCGSIFMLVCSHQWSGRFLGIITSWDPSVCKSNRLHIDILRFSFIKIGYIFINSSKMTGNFPAVFNFNRLLLKLSRFICN